MMEGYYTWRKVYDRHCREELVLLRRDIQINGEVVEAMYTTACMRLLCDYAAKKSKFEALIELASHVDGDV
ncbi:hypothetical protein J7293_04449 [Nakaseomyces glabratus]|nr:hypothetical protein J7294_04456 [Nakaseomyces glabratus]KAH7602062.1 hypothetical protein J7293_04449 [Nakaseomyces glabratus]